MYLRPQGWGELCDPTLDNAVHHDTFTCGHCNSIVIVQPRCAPEDLGGLCKMCMNLICKRCYGQVMSGSGCTIWERRMEEAERRAKFNQAFDAALNGEFY